jgi:hypothetical protein
MDKLAERDENMRLKLSLARKIQRAVWDSLLGRG